MSIIKENPLAETDGIAPKVAWPTVALAALGVVVCILDQLGVIDVEDELWLTLLGSAVGVGGLGYKAPPALQKTKGLRASRTTDTP
jgi:hypothetical protein